MQVNLMSVSPQSTKNNNTNNKNKNNIQHKQMDHLSDYPKSYVMFKGYDDKTAKEKHQAQVREDIALYLKYKDFNVKEAEENIKNNTDARIKILEAEKRKNARFYNRRTLSKLKKMQIEEEERQNFLKDKANYDKVNTNIDYYKNLTTTEDIKVYDETKKILSNKYSSMDSRIAGYGEEKKVLHDILIDPIQRETAMGTNEKIVSSVLLYGPMGCGKTSLAKSAAEETGAKVVIFGRQSKDGHVESFHPQQFVTILSSEIKAARKKYKYVDADNKSMIEDDSFKNASPKEKAKTLVELKSPRTIIIIDEADKYFDPQVEGNSPEIVENNKTFMKGILDHCSEKPDGDFGEDASGVTIIFATNRPSKIDSELSLRKGKCVAIPILPPENSDVKDILGHYMYQENEDLKDIIELGEHENSQLLDPVDLDQFPIEDYAKDANSNLEKGVISCAGIEQSVKKSFSDYTANPDAYIDITLGENLQSPQNRIPKPKLEEYMKEVAIMGKQMKELDDKEEISLLNELQDLDMIEPQQAKRLQYMQNAEKDKQNNR